MPSYFSRSFKFAVLTTFFSFVVIVGCSKPESPTQNLNDEPSATELEQKSESTTQDSNDETYATESKSSASNPASEPASATTVDYAPATSESVSSSLAALDGKAEFIGPTITGSHASTIAEMPNGTLVAAWLGRPSPDDEAIAVWSAIFRDGSWTEAKIVATVPDDMPDYSPEGRINRLWNPVLFQDDDGSLYLFYKVGPTTADWRGLIRKSVDGGETWEDFAKLPEGFVGPVKNKPVRLKDGSILAPSSTETFAGEWTVHLERAPKIGGEWTKTAPLNTSDEGGAIQPSVLFHPDGRLQLICRNKDGDENLWTFWSEDGGATWSKMEQLSLPNPNSGTDAVTLRDGRQLLVYNHSTTKTGDRTRLNVAVSDDGVNWRAACVLENEPGTFDYSYPAVIQTSDGKIQITYTWRWERIKRATFDPAKLDGVPIVDGVWPEEVR